MRIVKETGGFKLVELVSGCLRWVDADNRGLMPFGEFKDFGGDVDPMSYHPSRWDYAQEKERATTPATTAETVCERFALDVEELGSPALWIKAKSAAAQIGQEIEEALAEKMKAEKAARAENKPTKNSKAAREAARLAWRVDVALLEARRALEGLRAAKEIAETFARAAGIEAGLIERPG